MRTLLRRQLFCCSSVPPPAVALAAHGLASRLRVCRPALLCGPLRGTELNRSVALTQQRMDAFTAPARAVLKRARDGDSDVDAQNTASQASSSVCSGSSPTDDGAHTRTTRLSPKELASAVSARLSISTASAAYVLSQMKDGATVAFLARYRKDATGGLDEDVLRAVARTADEVAAVHRRREFMLKSLSERGLLTPELQRVLMAMAHVSQLEDFWEPYKVQRTSLATRAREAGLAPLVEIMLRSTDPLPPTAMQAIQGIEDGRRLFVALLAEELQRCEQLRRNMLRYLQGSAGLCASVVKTARKRAAKEMRDNDFAALQQKFGYYDGRRYPVKYVNGHTVLALRRGEAKGVLKVDLVPGGQCQPICLHTYKQLNDGVRSRYSTNGGRVSRYSADELALLQDGVRTACDSLLKSASNTIRRDLKRSAEREAIAVFAHNLRHMLLQRPLSHARVLALDPGITNGVKCVALDEAGDLLAYFKCTLMEEHRMAEQIASAVESHKLNKIVIGNGTASQQTAQLVARTIRTRKWTKVEFAVVSEAGASVYSVSDAAKEEFPALDVMYRGAVSIGRRVMDPLSELVKIPVRSMGIGMYQHDVNEKELLAELHAVVESCVALVGVNSASTNRYVMERVPGIHKKLVDQIVLARRNKRLGSRHDLRAVPGMTDAVYRQIAGFFRFPNSPEPLDNTHIHPESYALVRELLRLLDAGALGYFVSDGPGTPGSGADHGGNPRAHAAGDEAVKRQRVALAVSALPDLALGELASKLGCGPETLRLVAEELRGPALDPRSSLPHAGLLRRDIVDKKRLERGDSLVGVVQSITTFGAFVDCGMHDAVLLRGQDVVDRLHVGQLLRGITFNGLDKLGRPQVTYEPPANANGGEASAGRAGPARGLALEAEDVVGAAAAAAGSSGSLSEHVAQAREQGGKGQTQTAPARPKRVREGTPSVEADVDTPPAQAHQPDSRMAAVASEGVPRRTPAPVLTGSRAAPGAREETYIDVDASSDDVVSAPPAKAPKATREATCRAPPRTAAPTRGAASPAPHDATSTSAIPVEEVIEF